MENNQNENRKIIRHNFAKHPKLALKLLEDEKKAREAMREKYKQKKDSTNHKD